MSFDLFEWAVSGTIDLEGGLSKNSRDPGNWTTGQIGHGELKGTKYGISAASYPDEDIANLTVEQAKAIYRRDFWQKMGCDGMTRRLAVLVFDAAVQHSPEVAAEWLHTPLEFESFFSRRLAYYASLPGFFIEDGDPSDDFGRGWVNRMARLLDRLTQIPDSVDTVVFGQQFSTWQLLQGALSRRLDGGFLYRERPLAGGKGGKIDLRPRDS